MSVYCFHFIKYDYANDYKKGRDRYSHKNNLDLQRFVDSVYVSVNEYGELCLEKKTNEELAGITPVRKILSEMNFKSAYSECIKSCVHDCFKPKGLIDSK